MWHKRKLVFLLAVFVQTNAIAQLWIPSFVSDNMVLQQKNVFHLEGKSIPGSKVVVTGGWSKKSLIGITNNTGDWKINLPTSKAGGPYNLIISSGTETITRKNILLGEVWICSGQSNMEWSVDLGIENGAAAAANANWPQIRMLYVPKAESDTLLSDANAGWQTCTPEVMRKFSAVGYYFGRKLHQELNVPIGL